MSAPIIPIGKRGRREALALAAAALRRGGVVAFPTDTFYALGVDPWNGAAVAALYGLKGRPEDKPVLLLVADPSWAGRLWGRVDPSAALLMERFWPGPLTIIAPAGPAAPGLPAGRGLALRMPGNPATLALLARAGIPLTGTSANPSGRLPARSAGEAAGYFPEGLDLVLDGGTYAGGPPSTIVECGPSGPVLVREGAVGAAEIAAAGKRPAAEK